MKITAGLGSIDDYPAYAEAGADELFAGFVPPSWQLLAGEAEPFNRREVSFVNVQLGTESELEILRDMITWYHVPVTITINSPFYQRDRYSDILECVKICMSYGLHSFIAADPLLLSRLSGQKLPGIRLHLSGEFGTANRFLPERARKMGISRIIFPRQTPLCDMADMVLQDRKRHPDCPMEYEAFVLNEKCEFSGGSCMGVHCDAFPPVCRLPYQLENGESGEEEIRDVPGASGCGLCSLYALRDLGITHAKLVSRGERTQDTIRDIRLLRRALAVLEESESQEAYIRAMKHELFPDGCSGQCYYLREN